MPKSSGAERVPGEYYQWILQKRGGVFYADGRGNRPDLGRRSLSTRDPKIARERLREHDHQMAVKHGLAAPTAVGAIQRNPLSLETGMQKYLSFVGRSRALGGARATTVKRYGPPLTRFVAFARNDGLTTWQEVRGVHIRDYCQSLHVLEYRPRTQTLEGTLLKQVLKWLAQEGLIEPVNLKNCSFKKVVQSDVHCYSDDEVKAMINHCRKEPALRWLGDVIIVLANTGLRIGELVELRWTDLDFDKQTLTLRDTTLLEPASKQKDARRTKSGRDRWIPLHPDVVDLLSKRPRSADGRVFHGPKGGNSKAETLRRALVRDVIKPLIKRSGGKFSETFGRGRLHSFRHYFCSRAAEQGISELMLREWLGHSSSQMVARYYHQRPAAALKQIRQLSSLTAVDENGG